jgi:predicted enzyme related to lactoylglutathione lyase
MPSPIVHFQITSPNAEKTAQFLRDVFDWQPGEARAGADTWLDTGASQVAPNDIFVNGSLRSGEPSVAATTIVYVRVADLDGTLEKAVKHGGSIVMPRRDNAGAPSIAIVSAPDGLVVGVVQL